MPFLDNGYRTSVEMGHGKTRIQPLLLFAVRVVSQ